MTGVRVLLVDDHEMLTDALAARLSASPDIWVVGRCTTADWAAGCAPGAGAASGAASGSQPDVIAVEAGPVGEAAGLLARLRRAWPQARIVVLTASQDPGQPVDAARAGADGWVSKQSSVDTLVQAVRCAGRGHAFFPPEQLGPVLRALRKDLARAQRRAGALDVLTARERAVLLGLSRGRTAAEIAGELGVSPNTVRTHTNKIFSKLRVHSRLEAVRAARLAGIGPPTAPPAPDVDRVPPMTEDPPAR